jgi:hypothetical protein
MTWAGLYPGLLTLHVLSALAFIALHGVSMGVWWRVRRERERARLKAWLELSLGFIGPAMVGGQLLIVSGILVGIAGSWWFDGRWWLWLSIGLLVAIVALMTPMVAIPLASVRHGLGIPDQTDRKAGITPPVVDDAELERRLADPRPAIGSALAIVGVIVITWLMETKPI